MKTSRYSIYPLRGMDHRWRPPDVGARRIRDMRYDRRDGWKDAGGFSPIMPKASIPVKMTAAPSAVTHLSPFHHFGEIESLHWFSQHGGRRQWLIWEAEWLSEGMTFFYFNGSNAGTFGAGFTEIRDAAGLRLPWYGAGTSAYYGRRQHSGPRPRTQSMAWNGYLYLVNGADPPLVFDGTKAERAGFDIHPSAPSGQSTDHGRSMIASVGLGTSALNLPNDGEEDASPLRSFGYRYRVSFVNERGQESPLSAPSGVIIGKNPSSKTDDELPSSATDGWNGDNRKGKKFIHVTIPQGGETVVARRIYRTKNVLDAYGAANVTGAAEHFYFLKEVRDNLSTSWEDGVPDGYLGGLVDELDFGPWPQRANMIAAFKNTVFLAGTSNSDISYSAPLMPEVFPVDNIISCGQDSSGEITGMYTTKNALVVFKRGAIYLIKGDPSSGFYAQPLTKDTGCVGPDAMAEIPGLGLAFLGDNGVYLLKGALENTGTITSIEQISTPIDDDMQRINMSAAIQSVAMTYRRDREWWLCVPIDGSEKNNFVFVFHYDVGSWSYRENYPVGCGITTNDHRGHLIFGSNLSGDDGYHRGGCQVYHTGAPHKGITYPSIGSAKQIDIEPMYETADLNFGSTFTAVAPKYFMVNCIGYGNNDIEVKYAINRSITDVRTTAKSSDQQNPEERYDVYGTVTWGSGTWAEHRPIALRFDVSTTDQPAVRELRVTIEPAGRRIQVMGMDIGIVSSAAIQRIPINEVLLGKRG